MVHELFRPTVPSRGIDEAPEGAFVDCASAVRDGCAADISKGKLLFCRRLLMLRPARIAADDMRGKLLLCRICYFLLVM